MPERKEAAVVVAHPDDETLWAGGAILGRTDCCWTIVTACRRSDTDRSAKFFRALERLGATGAMGDLDDGAEQKPLELEVMEKTILSLLPRTDFDLLVTHSPFGEYSRHRRHEETSRAVTRLWARGRLTARELWLFAYEDSGGRYLPRAIRHADLKTKLDETVWTAKADIIHNTYGFETDSWEFRTTPRVEAFWRFEDAAAYHTWLEKEQKLVRGDSE